MPLQFCKLWLYSCCILFSLMSDANRSDDNLDIFVRDDKLKNSLQSQSLDLFDILINNLFVILVIVTGIY